MQILVPVFAAVLFVAPSMAQAPIRTKAAPVAKVQTLAPVTPVGAPVTGLAISGTPLVAALTWTPAANAVGYQVFRTDGPNTAPILITPSPIPPKAGARFTNTVPDPRITYEYLVVATYSDGTTGEGRATFISPPPTNPKSVTAKDLGNGSFALSWPAVPGAIGYRVDGATLPNSGQMVTPPTTTIANVPAGPQTWGVVAMFPGNFADYTSGPKVNVVSRPLPPHSIPFLVKGGGPGDATLATMAMERATLGDWRGTPYPSCADPQMADRCTTAELLTNWGVLAGPNGLIATIQTEPIPFINRTELGTSRVSRCFESEGNMAGQALICYTESPGGLTAIVQSALGMRFVSFKPSGNGGASGTLYSSFITSLTKTFDAEGPKFAPHACLACHGGRYDPNTRLVQGATLLPIDPGLVDLGGQRSRYEESIRKFNAMIYRPPVGQPSPAVAQYINEMYGGTGPTGGAVLVPGAQAAANHVPRGWASEAGFYQNVVKKNCAMCHLGTNPALNLNFQSSGNFLQHKDAIFNAVCKFKTMPHAETPFRRFWTDDTGPVYLPGVLASRLGFPACA